MKLENELVICPICHGKSCEKCNRGYVTQEEYEDLYCEQNDI